MTGKPGPPSYYRGVADAYENAEGSAVAAVRQHLGTHSLSTARNAIYRARKMGFLPPTRKGRPTTGTPLHRLAEQLMVDPEDLRIATDMAQVRIASRKPRKVG